jgi:hypothetical protein
MRFPRTNVRTTERFSRKTGAARCLYAVPEKPICGTVPSPRSLRQAIHTQTASSKRCHGTVDLSLLSYIPLSSRFSCWSVNTETSRHVARPPLAVSAGHSPLSLANERSLLRSMVRTSVRSFARPRLSIGAFTIYLRYTRYNLNPLWIGPTVLTIIQALIASRHVSRARCRVRCAYLCRL